MIKLFLIILLLSGCCVKAQKGDEIMILRGFGAKSAKFSDGSEIHKDEPFSVPDIMPVSR